MKNNPVLNLQDVVDSYNEPAVLISDSYEIICANSAYKNLYRVPVHDDPAESKNYCEEDGLLSDQCYCYEVSHHYSRSCDQEGESCPLQLAKTTQNNQRVLHIHQTRFGEEHVDVSLFPIHDENGQLFFLEVMKTIKHASPQVGHKGMVGKSQAFNRLLSLVNRVSQHDISVLLQGESGSGKELVAHAIHQASARHSSACVTVECSGLSESLFESELFGHEKGSFTGAVTRRIGKFEEANGGTIFLDEIAEMDLNLQAKLLRVIQEREVTRVGGNTIIPIDVRLLVATHKNLADEVKKGNFREDLYYRLLGLPIQLPPLRERDTDILLLAKHFLTTFCGENDLGDLSLGRETQEKLLRYHYPGNIRELKSVIELSAVMSNEDIILPEDINFSSPKSEENFTYQELSLKEYNDRIIDHFLKKYDNNVLKVADVLDIGKSTIYRYLKEKTI